MMFSNERQLKRRLRKKLFKETPPPADTIEEAAFKEKKNALFIQRTYDTMDGVVQVAFEKESK